MQRSLSQKYFHGRYILTWTTLKGMKNAGSFSFFLAITMNMSQWRQRLPKYMQYVLPHLWQKKSKSQTYAQSNSASERFKAAAFCKENYPIPSCPQLRRRHGCSSTINSLLYSSTCMFCFFFFGFLPCLWRRLLAAQVGLKIPITQSSTCFLKAQAAKTPWKKYHWDRL